MKTTAYSLTVELWQKNKSIITSKILAIADKNVNNPNYFYEQDGDVIYFPFYDIDNNYDNAEIIGTIEEEEIYTKYISSLWQAILTLTNFEKYEKLIYVLKTVDINGL